MHILNIYIYIYYMFRYIYTGLHKNHLHISHRSLPLHPTRHPIHPASFGRLRLRHGGRFRGNRRRGRFQAAEFLSQRYSTRRSGTKPLEKLEVC